MGVTYFFDEGPLTYLSPVSEMTGLPVATQVTADDYLSYAKSDLAHDGNQGSINALGNVKRSLHLMIDTLLQNYGLLAQNSNLHFPAKLTLLDDVGLISLNVFRKLNVERNLAEHEYTVPSREQVEDFVDVCQLLRLAMEHLGESIPCRAAAGLRDSGEHVLLALEPAQGSLNIFDLTDPRLSSSEVFGTQIEYVSTGLVGGERNPSADVGDEPQRSLTLEYRSREKWLPLLRQFIDSRSSQHGRATVVHEGVVTIWMSRHLAVDQIAGSSLGDLLGLRPGGDDSDQR